MAALEIELWVADAWRPVGTIRPGDPSGSISSDEPAGRQVYVFGWLEGIPGVWRSVAGVDLETPQLREIHTEGLEQLADLRNGPLEVQRYGPIAGQPYPLRFRLDLAK